MKITTAPAGLTDILPMRVMFLHEGNFQFVCNSYHTRNWADSYLLNIDENTVGYGCLLGLENRAQRDCVFEFYVLPPYRKYAGPLFKALVTASNATGIYCQSNDALLTQMLYMFTSNIRPEAILFEDHCVTQIICNDVIFRKKQAGDKVFEHKVEPEGDYVLDIAGEVVATGGFLLHYNMPYADLYMEVKDTHRRKGYGSFLIQEIKKACYLAGRVPAARTGTDNHASKATLLKAGFKVCGYRLTADISAERLQDSSLPNGF